MHYTEYPDNAVYTGIYYRVTRKGSYSRHTFIPGESFELPVSAGDVIDRYSAPKGLDAALTIADFSELVGPCWPNVTRVKVMEGTLINESVSERGTGTWREVASEKHALKLAAQYNATLARNIAARAEYEADIAEVVTWGKYDNESFDDFVARHRIGPGWFVRPNGYSVWSEIRDVFGSFISTHGSRNLKERGRSYDPHSKTIHPKLEAKVHFRPNVPKFGEASTEKCWYSNRTPFEYVKGR